MNIALSGRRLKPLDSSILKIEIPAFRGSDGIDRIDRLPLLCDGDIKISNSFMIYLYRRGLTSAGFMVLHYLIKNMRLHNIAIIDNKEICEHVGITHCTVTVAINSLIEYRALCPRILRVGNRRKKLYAINTYLVHPDDNSIDSLDRKYYVQYLEYDKISLDT